MNILKVKVSQKNKHNIHLTDSQKLWHLQYAYKEKLTEIGKLKSFIYELEDKNKKLTEENTKLLKATKGELKEFRKEVYVQGLLTSLDKKTKGVEQRKKLTEKVNELWGVIAQLKEKLKMEKFTKELEYLKED